MSQASRDRMPIALVARIRAAWNKDGGGVLLTGEYGKCDHNGSHYRVVVDGGNEYHGRKQWVISRCNGGGYALNDEAMASAVAQVLDVPLGFKEDEVHNNSWGANWKEIARKHGWTLYEWECANTVVMIPDEETAKNIKKEQDAWDAAHPFK